MMLNVCCRQRRGSVGGLPDIKLTLNKLPAEILTWLDDHSRYVVSLTAHHRVTGPAVVTAFRAARHRLRRPSLDADPARLMTRLRSRARNLQAIWPPASFNVVACSSIVQFPDRAHWLSISFAGAA
jgi:hypothetical protein